MVEYRLELPRHQNTVWLPKALVATMGRKMRIVPNDLVAIVYREGVGMDDVLKSLRVLEQHFELKANRERQVKLREQGEVTAAEPKQSST